jgi:exopolysaccharide biosynthesis polyprenyl glycosylphosphotransferase
VLSLWIGHWLRSAWGKQIPNVPGIDPFSNFIWIVFIVVPFGPLFLDLYDFYSSALRKTLLKSIAQISRAFIWLGLLILGADVFFHFDVKSRSVILLSGAISAVFLLLKEQLTIAYLRGKISKGSYREKVIVVGTPEENQTLVNRLIEDQLTEIETVETIDIGTQPVTDMIAAIHKHSVGRVIFAASKTELNRLEEAVAACEIEGVEAWVIADFIRTSIARPSFDMFGSQPMLVFKSTPDHSWALVLKRIFDFIGSLLGLILLAPFLILIAIAIRLTSKGPAIFTQLRAGRYGQPFKMYKFRSMYSDSEQRRHELEAFNQMSGPVFKIKDDPRITPLGRWLRRYSIDELPQLINILTGHMSLVGPRPLPTYEVANFENGAQRRRLSMKPGLTCLWQIRGRNEVSNFEEWLRLDLAYIDNWSFSLDLQILFQTIPAVLTGQGAD